jgi:pimeloyl-ACP methyl ester carboxylesterase
MKEITKGYINTKNCQVHFYESGTGKTILLLHPTPNAQFFLKTIPYLANKYNVISIDTPGYGNSSRPNSPFTSLEEYASEIMSFIKIKKLKSVTLVGHMTGAVTALATAIKGEGYIDQLILGELIDWSKNSKPHSHHDNKFLEPMNDGSHLLSIWHKYADMFSKLDMIDIQSRFLTEFLAEYGSSLYPLNNNENSSSHKLFNWQDSTPKTMFNYNVSKALREIAIPTLLLCGNASKLRSGASPFEEQQKLLSLLSIGQSAILKDQNHTAPLIAPELYASSILSFLNNLKN